MADDILLVVVGTIFSIASSMAVWTGRQTNLELRQLRDELSHLVTRLSVLERVVDSLPPPQWRTKIELLEQRVHRLEHPNNAD